MKRYIVFIIFFIGTLHSLAQFNTNRLMATGRNALYYEDYVLSIQYFNQAINAKPYLYEPWYLRGIAKFYLDDYTGAVQDVDKAINLNPYIAGMYELRGLSHIRLKNFKEAITDYDKTLTIDAQNQSAWYNRSLCKIELKDYDAAQADLDKMVKKWKKYASAYSLKAEVFLMQKDTVEAAKWLDKSLDIDPYDGNAWSTRAMVAMARREWKDADTFLSKAIHLKPKTVSNYINRSLARYNTNNLRGALDDYDTALDLDPNNFLAHYNRGLLRMQLGDDNRAITDFNFVIKMEPNNYIAIFNRAILHDKTGNLHAAIRDYSTVIAQFPNFWTGLSRRANCYRRMGLTAKAELDEFKIMKAQMNKHLGIQPRWNKNKTKQMRRRSEIDPEKYNQIVVADENTQEHEYKSSYRGKVQNRAVGLHFRPMYGLSLFKYDNGVRSYQAFANEVEQYNAQHKKEARLYVNCMIKKLDEHTSQQLLTRADSLSAAIDISRSMASVSSTLLQRAVTYTVLQNFDAAISDLEVFISTDSTSALGYWQRGICQAMANDYNRAQGTDVQIAVAKAKADIEKALMLSSQNAYLHYDMGNILAANKEYDEAIKQYNSAININPYLAEAYYNRGLAYILNGKKAEGVESLSKAGELGLYDAYSVIKQNSKGAK